MQIFCSQKMNTSNNVPFNLSEKPKEAAPVYKPTELESTAFSVNRIPRGFREAMEYISVQQTGSSHNKPANMSAKAPRSGVRPAPKWKSTFKPLDDEEDSSPDKSTSSPQRVELYDPYDPASSDSENEMLQGHDDSHSQTDQNNHLERQRLSPCRGSHDKHPWDSPYPEPARLYLDRHDFSSENRPSESQGLSPVHRLAEQRAYSPATEGYGSLSRLLDNRISSPDRLVHGSATESFPESYGTQRTNGDERITLLEYQREMTATGRLSPSSLHRDYQHQLRYAEMGLDKITPSTEVNRNGSKSIIMDKNPITCELCFVELANGQELQDHLESKTHWDTLEHIQKEKDYDDLTIAFLQEVMLHKSRQCSRAIEDSVLKALHENDHMTKIEIFHCAACNIILTTSASSVQTHIISQEHICNIKEFEVHQRLACLDKAETMMMELKPQFERFLKGDSLFE